MWYNFGMKKRIIVLLSLAILVYLIRDFAIIQTPIAWTIIGLLILVQAWIIYKNRINRAITIGNYSAWAALIMVGGAEIIGIMAPHGALGFSKAFGLTLVLSGIGLVLFLISVISFIIGAILPDTTTISPNL